MDDINRRPMADLKEDEENGPRGRRATGSSLRKNREGRTSPVRRSWFADKEHFGAVVAAVTAASQQCRSTARTNKELIESACGCMIADMIAEIPMLTPESCGFSCSRQKLRIAIITRQQGRIIP
ncbi:hypothetical protein BHM03_00034491 [Ensete ventricosum]|nr:hypothetical protein BHM03_00034491 [Ensete ventricosum]